MPNDHTWHSEDLWTPRERVPQPADQIKAKAKVTMCDRTKWITYSDEIKRSRKTIPIIVEMPENALTKSCHKHRHHDCNHRRGAAHESGVWLKVTKPSFLWRCGCPCHSDPERVGLLF